MIRDIPPLAVEGIDPWEKVQIEPATRRLAEHAAAAAGIPVEEWLERAIRRACPSAFKTAPVTVPPMPLSSPPSARPDASVPAQTPRPAVTPPIAPAATAPIPPRDIEASLAALLAMAQRGTNSPPEPAPALVPPPPQPQASPVIPAAPARPPAAAIGPLPAALRPAPSLAERLAQQRLDQAETEPRIENDDKAERGPPQRMEPRPRSKLWARRGAADLGDESIGRASPADHTARSAAPGNVRRWGLIAVGIALAIAAGAFSAQRLVPSRDSASRVALAPSTATSDAPLLAPAPPDAGSLPSLNNNGDESIPGLPSMPGQPAMPPPAAAQPAMPPASLGNGSNTPAANLPPVPGLPNLPLANPTPPVASLTAPPSVLPAVPSVPTPPAEESAPPAASAPVAPRIPSTKTAMALARPTPHDTRARPSKATAPEAKPPSRGAVPAGGEAPTDPAKLVPWLEQRANNGDAIAQYRLGVLYALGQGVTQDYQHAAQLFKSSADAGVAEAQYNIAVMYSEGLGIGRDPNQAVAWYRKAAAQGNANAAFNLGVAYSNGVGVPQSMDQAAQWFRHAASSGVVNAQFNLGLLYERGDGVPVSQVEAYAWYSAAAARGDTGAAQRRDRLASILAPSALKEAQERAQEIETTLRGSAAPNATTGGATPAALNR